MPKAGGLRRQPRIGLALGSGSARGWAHIGVINELTEAGMQPAIISGTSIGAIVGAIHSVGRLEALERWVTGLTRRDVLGYLDLAFSGGGVFDLKRLMEVFQLHFGDLAIEDLDTPFAAVATDLRTGLEVWLRSGPIIDALRASISLPGIFTPVKWGDTWLVDGGLVNPVPVSLCRAMGAELVIAVNLNGDLMGRHLDRSGPVESAEGQELQHSVESGWLDRVSAGFRDRASLLLSQLRASDGSPGMFDVIATSLNIMQDRITRSRMAGDPADLVLSPRLSQIALLEFDRAADAIHEGRACVRRMLPAIEDLLSL